VVGIGRRQRDRGDNEGARGFTGGERDSLAAPLREVGRQGGLAEQGDERAAPSYRRRRRAQGRLLPVGGRKAGARQLFRRLLLLHDAGNRQPRPERDGLAMQAPAPFYREAGGGPSVICLHASASSSRQWLPLMEYLSPRYHVLAADCYGAG